ncbi:hypothetical protein BOTBODRAFT_36928 [Botryobasidium botryosum FD-172 SS1]|uniref:Aminoglycoside phosphotransferase domain-containing protein n=1 Tax=Botryobasidium botryosum (strain FD-172 SS1) TaxID=930990 RepID=A0A067M476_BOTB1|nr:hypothetical protein BOTBODRAFT_36928 [Botryobasidium botryosum FD-172 SS1]
MARYAFVHTRDRNGRNRLHLKSPQGQIQFGAHHTAERHTSLLERWLLLVRPAILPQNPELYAPILGHPDLHVSNILINTIKPGGGANTTIALPHMTLSGVLDWQHATTHPRLEAAVPVFPDPQ